MNKNQEKEIQVLLDAIEYELKEIQEKTRNIDRHRQEIEDILLDKHEEF